MLREMTYYSTAAIVSIAYLGLITLCMIKNNLKEAQLDTLDKQ
jgi:hypothetical protein